MSHLSTKTDLAALFQFDLDTLAAATASAPSSAPLCGKCHGRGNFISYTGRIVGKCFACDGTGFKTPVSAAPVTAAIDVDAIATAFAAARENGIKSPKLRLEGFTFSRAPDSGRNPGSIYVKAGDEYLGKVSESRFQASSVCDSATKARVIAAAADPHNSAKAYGLKTGQCSCCGRELTNGLSIELGIGPICRGKFGWG